MPAIRVNCFRCSVTYSTLCPTSRANLSVLSSLRVSLSTIYLEGRNQSGNLHVSTAQAKIRLGGECLREVGDKVLDVLHAHGQTNQGIGDPQRSPLLRRDGSMRHDGRMLDEA